MTNGPDHTQLDPEFEPGSEVASSAGAGDDLPAGSAALAALEASLREALAPQDPPAGFADRVLTRAFAVPATFAHPPAAALLPWPRRHRWLSGLIAAGLVFGALEGELAYKRMREQQQRILQATRQFETSERITMRALAQARQQLQRAGVPLDLD